MLSLYITVINKGLKSGLISGRATHHPPGRQKLNELMFVCCTHTAHSGSVGAPPRGGARDATYIRPLAGPVIVTCAQAISTISQLGLKDRAGHVPVGPLARRPLTAARACGSGHGSY